MPKYLRKYIFSYWVDHKKQHLMIVTNCSVLTRALITVGRHKYVRISDSLYPQKGYAKRDSKRSENLSAAVFIFCFVFWKLVSLNGNLWLNLHYGVNLTYHDTRRGMKVWRVCVSIVVPKRIYLCGFLWLKADVIEVVLSCNCVRYSYFKHFGRFLNFLLLHLFVK